MIERVVETSSERRFPRGRPPSTEILTRLTEAGLSIMRHEDPTALTIERVCQEAGVSRATFYRRWKNLNPVFFEMGRVLLERGSPGVVESGDLREDIIRAVNRIAQLLCDERVGGLFRYAFARAGQDEEIKRMVQALDCQRNAPLIALIERAKVEGRIRADFPSEFIAYQLFGPIWHRTLLLQIAPTPAFIETVVDTIYRSISASDRP